MIIIFYLITLSKHLTLLLRACVYGDEGFIQI